MKADEEEVSKFFYLITRERKELWTMPSAAKGAASPWFEVRAQKPADGKSETN
jgi:isopentenyldiphosphate isomerase